MCVCVHGAQKRGCVVWLSSRQLPWKCHLSWNFGTACPDLRTLKSLCMWPLQRQIMSRNNAESSKAFGKIWVVCLFVCLFVAVVDAGFALWTQYPPDSGAHPWRVIHSTHFWKYRDLK